MSRSSGVFTLSSRLSKFVLAFISGFFIIFLFLPIIWMILTSLKPNTEIFVQFPSVLPSNATLDSYSRATSSGGIGTFLINSAICAGGSAFATTVLAAFAAYGFAKFRFFGRQPIMLAMIAAQMLPFGLVLIGLYPTLAELNLLNTRFGLSLGYIVFALPPGIYVMYAFLVKVPTELIESARIDGASELTILTKIVLPLAVPALVSVWLYSLMWAWNDLLYALTLVTSEKLRTIGPGLLLRFFGEMQQDWGAAMAASILVSLPVVVMFGLLQRYFLQGLTVGAVKG